MARSAPRPATGDVRLRDVTARDLPHFFEHQLDPEAARMAAFPIRDREPFMAHWTRILGDDSIIKRTILVDGRVAGNIGCFEQGGEREVGYWLGREYWGRGVATRALAAFLDQVQARPLTARVASHNTASRRVLEKCGFIVCGEGAGGPGAGDGGVEEVLLQLGASGGDEAR